MRSQRNTQPSKLPRPRTWALLDLENLALGHRLHTPEAILALAHAFEVMSLQPDDHLVVGAARSQAHAAVAATIKLTGRLGRLVIGHGISGADRALLAAVDDEGGVNALAQRFTRVVIGSGDGIFSAFAAAAAGSGLEVEVVAADMNLAGSLRDAACTTHSYAIPTGFEVAA